MRIACDTNHIVSWHFADCETMTEKRVLVCCGVSKWVVSFFSEEDRKTSDAYTNRNVFSCKVAVGHPA